MKKVILSAAVVLLSLSQVAFGQATQEAKKTKKIEKAEKKMEKAADKVEAARENRGPQIAGVSTDEARLKKAEKKRDKAQKKLLKARVKKNRAEATEYKKAAARVN